MATLTIRNVPTRVVHALKARAKRHNTSLAQEVRDLLEQSVAERAGVFEDIEASWEQQSRRPSAREIDSWISTGRE